MVNILVLFVMTLLFVACDDSSVDTSAENDILSSSYEGESSSSLDTLEYVAPPKLSGKEYNPDFNAIISNLAPPLYNDGKWVMGRFESKRVGTKENGLPIYDRYYVFFVSKDDMATWEKTDTLRCNRSDNITSAFTWKDRFYYLFHTDEDTTFFFSSKDGSQWDSLPVVGLPAEFLRDSVLYRANFHVANNKVFVTSNKPCYVTSDLETWQEMKLRDGGSACGNNVAWGEPGYRMSGASGVIMYSDDGITWDSTSTSGTLNGYQVAYGNGVFVRGTYSGRDALQWSRDGLEWNPTRLENGAGSSIFYEGVIFDGGIFLAYGGGMMAGSTSYLLVSENGQDWVLQDRVAYRDIERVVYGNGQYVASIYGENYYAVFQKEP